MSPGAAGRSIQERRLDERSRDARRRWFDTNLEEAAEFDTSIFPNSRIETFERYTEAGPGTPGDVVSGTFVLDGTRFLGITG
jgi:predicted 3-demethylubiquinone-9 3-methyltransferase (glyoxalase superfamily)